MVKQLPESMIKEAIGKLYSDTSSGREEGRQALLLAAMESTETRDQILKVLVEVLKNPQAQPTNANDPANNRLVVNSVGLHTWESVYIVRKGANYGYPLREGNEMLKNDNTTTSLPAVDKIPVQVSDITDETVVPVYPVIKYGHVPGGGDAIGAGFLYNGKALPVLRGKYIFTDITTGRVWYADYKDMLAADDGKPETLAAIHEVKISWNGKLYDTMFPIAEAAYQARGGKAPHLPGRGTVSGDGRADSRLTIDGAGELYMYSKTDGVIRAVVGATAK